MSEEFIQTKKKSEKLSSKFRKVISLNIETCFSLRCYAYTSLYELLPELYLQGGTNKSVWFPGVLCCYSSGTSPYASSSSSVYLLGFFLIHFSSKALPGIPSETYREVAEMAMKILGLLLFLAIAAISGLGAEGSDDNISDSSLFRYDFYEKTCPDVEKIIYYAMQKIISQNKNAPAQLLRLLFHDCFIEVIP